MPIFAQKIVPISSWNPARATNRVGLATGHLFKFYWVCVYTFKSKCKIFDLEYSNAGRQNCKIHWSHRMCNHSIQERRKTQTNDKKPQINKTYTLAPKTLSPSGPGLQPGAGWLTGKADLICAGGSLKTDHYHTTWDRWDETITNNTTKGTSQHPEASSFTHLPSPLLYFDFLSQHPTYYFSFISLSCFCMAKHTFSQSEWLLQTHIILSHK